MKKIFLFLTVALSMVLASCGDDEKQEVFVEDLTYAVLGEWYAELPMVGETPDRLSEEGELAPYDRVVVLMNVDLDQFSNIVLFLYGEELIRFDYGIYLSGRNPYTMDREGNINFKTNPESGAQFRDSKYAKGVITSTLSIPEGELNLTFKHPETNEIFNMSKWMEIISQGFGYTDSDSSQRTDVTDDPATRPGRAPRR